MFSLEISTEIYCHPGLMVANWIDLQMKVYFQTHMSRRVEGWGILKQQAHVSCFQPQMLLQQLSIFRTKIWRMGLWIAIHAYIYSKQSHLCHGVWWILERRGHWDNICCQTMFAIKHPRVKDNWLPSTIYGAL